MFGEILKKTVRLTWKSPNLWFWGIFLIVLFVMTNEFFLIIFLSESISKSAFLSSNLLITPTHLPNFSQPYFGTIIIFLLTIILFSLSIFSEIFLISSFEKLDRKNKFVLKESWPEIKKSFLKVFLFRLIIFFILGLFWLIMTFSLLQSNKAFLFFLFSFLLLLTLSILFIVRYTIFYLVIEKKSIKEAIKAGISLFGKNWFKTVWLAIIVFLIFSLISLLFQLFLKVISYSLRLNTFFLTKLFGSYGFGLMFILVTLFFIFSQLVLIGIISAYQIGCWTLFFLRIKESFVNKQIEK